MFAENFKHMPGKIKKQNSGNNEMDAIRLIRRKELQNSALKKLLDFLEKERVERQSKS